MAALVHRNASLVPDALQEEQQRRTDVHLACPGGIPGLAVFPQCTAIRSMHFLAPACRWLLPFLRLVARQRKKAGVNTRGTCCGLQGQRRNVHGEGQTWTLVRSRQVDIPHRPHHTCTAVTAAFWSVLRCPGAGLFSPQVRQQQQEEREG